MKAATLAFLALAATISPAPANTTPEACGWPRPVQRQVLGQATRLMPHALARILRRHEHAVRQGAEAQRRLKPELPHAQGMEPGDGTAERLAASLARITALLDDHAPLKRVAREFGAASHLVTDLSNPFRTAPRDQDAALFEDRFLQYISDHLPNMRVVFTSYQDPLLESGLTTEFGRQLAAQSRSYLDDLVGAFRRFDASGDPAFMDERSVPFGVASLSYSRSVMDTARVWLHAWRQAHGDLTDLPFPLTHPETASSATGTKGPP